MLETPAESQDFDSEQIVEILLDRDGKTPTCLYIGKDGLIKSLPKKYKFVKID